MRPPATPGVLQPQRHLRRARAARRSTRRDGPASSSKSASQIQLDVAAVGDAVVEHREHVVLAGLERERAQHLVGAGGVLDEQDRDARGPPTRDRLRAPEGRLRRLAARRRSRSARDAQRARQCGGGERVVDVVEARAAAARRVPPAVEVEREARPAHAVEPMSRAATARRRARARRSSRSGSGRGGRGSARRRRRARRSAGSASRPRRAAARRARRRRPPRRSRARRRGRGRGRRSSGRRRSARAVPVAGVRDDLRPSARRSSRARRSGRAGRGRGCRAAARAGAAARRAPSSQNSSTSNSPRSPSLGASSVAAIAAGHVRARAVVDERARRCPRGSPAAIAAVVVLPFVAEITAQPLRKAAPRARSIGARVEAQQHLAGKARAAASRAAATRRRPSARAPAASRVRSALMRAAAPGRAAGTTRIVGRQLGDRVAVGVDRERAARADPDLRGARDASPTRLGRACP